MFRLYCVCLVFQSIWYDEFNFFSKRMFRASKRAWIDSNWIVNWFRIKIVDCVRFWNRIVDCVFEKMFFRCFCWILNEILTIDWFDNDRFVKIECFDDKKFWFRMFFSSQCDTDCCCILNCCLTFWNCWLMILMFFVCWFSKFWAIWNWCWQIINAIDWFFSKAADFWSATAINETEFDDFCNNLIFYLTIAKKSE